MELVHLVCSQYVDYDPITIHAACPTEEIANATVEALDMLHAWEHAR